MKGLGINLLGLVAQGVNFAILFFILNKYVFKTVLELVKRQDQQKKEAENKARQIEKEWEKISKTKEKEILKTEAMAIKILEDARTEAEEEAKEIINQARQGAEKIAEEQEKILKARENKMKLEVEEYSAKLAVKIAGKLIAQFMNKSKQRQVINQSLLQLKKII